jgi:hypothetical protein
VPTALAVTLVVLLVGLFSARRAGPPRNLRSGLWGAEAVELVAPPGPLLDAANRLAPGLSRSRGVEVRVLPSAEAGSARCTRIVIGTLASERAAALAAELGIESLDPGDPAAGFRFAGREYTDPGDLLAATLPDPERPGRPATLFLGADAYGLARHLAHVDPGWRPAFRTFRAGEPERDGPLAPVPDGATLAPREGEVLFRDLRAGALRASLTQHPVPGLRVLVPRDADLMRVSAYLPAAREARRRAANVLGAQLEDLHRPQVVLYDDAEEMDQVLGAIDLSLENRVALTAHVLLVPGVPDDGGAALARLAAIELLGPPGEEALLLGFGAWAAGSWLGAPLAHWPRTSSPTGVPSACARPGRSGGVICSSWRTTSASPVAPPPGGRGWPVSRRSGVSASRGSSSASAWSGRAARADTLDPRPWRASLGPRRSASRRSRSPSSPGPRTIRPRCPTDARCGDLPATSATSSCSWPRHARERRILRSCSPGTS